MWETELDINRALMVDGNAVAGLLDEILNFEVTTCVAQCAFCGKQGEIGAVLAFTHCPGIVLRCPYCENILIRVVKTPTSVFMDARGVTFLRMPAEE